MGRSEWASHPFAEADDGPQTEAQCATAIQTTTQKPPHIHRERLSQAAVHTIGTGFEFLWCHLREAHSITFIINGGSIHILAPSICILYEKKERINVNALVESDVNPMYYSPFKWESLASFFFTLR